MIEFSLIKLDLLTIHKVGNKSKGEEMFSSQEIYEPSEEQKQELMVYFLLPFKTITEVHKFRHSSDISYNEMHGLSSKIFKRPGSFLHKSIDMANHLYEQSDHHNIKSGEVFIAYFSEIIFEGQSLNAIGIFKSERKDSFFQFQKQGGKIVINTQKGVHSRKLDKGCLILETEQEDGFRVLTIDNNNYDAEYWTHKFLNIEDARDHNFQTRNYISLCKDFSSTVIESNEGKSQGLSFLNQSIKYLTENETLELEDFSERMFKSQKLKNQFRDFKEKFEKENDLEIADEFEISKATLNLQKKRLKNQINLDNRIQIKFPFTNTEIENRFIEKGYDEKKKMFFYKIYFNQETD